MKKTIFLFTFTLLVAFTACNNKKARYEKMEKEYDALFEKEYSEFLGSERYKTFKQRYQLLCDLCKEVEASSKISVTPMQLDTLCFEPIGVTDTYYEATDQNDTEIPIQTFESYKNLSDQVNAVMVAQEFYKPIDLASQFACETDIHDAFRLLDKKLYLSTAALMESNKSYIYDDFCRKRILMDEINHCKYFIILKLNHYVPSELDENTNTYLSGIYDATLYIYDIASKKYIRSIDIVASNSDVVEGLEYTLSTELDRDLGRNIENSIQNAIAPIKGELPQFTMNSTLFQLTQ